MKITLNEFLEANKKFNEYSEKNKFNKSFEVITGSIPILISAPHSVRQIRNGKIKEKDAYTGPIAIELQKQTNCYCIYKTKNNNDDANYDIKDNKYKEEILKIITQNKIELLLDIHGASDIHGFGVDIATGEGKNINQNKKLVITLKETLEKHDIKNVEIDKIFKANSIHTICKTISEIANIPCIELEISRTYRDIKNFNEIKKVIEGLREYIIKISNTDNVTSTKKSIALK